MLSKDQGIIVTENKKNIRELKKTLTMLDINTNGIVEYKTNYTYKRSLLNGTGSVKNSERLFRCKKGRDYMREVVRVEQVFNTLPASHIFLLICSCYLSAVLS